MDPDEPLVLPDPLDEPDDPLDFDPLPEDPLDAAAAAAKAFSCSSFFLASSSAFFASSSAFLASSSAFFFSSSATRALYLVPALLSASELAFCLAVAIASTYCDLMFARSPSYPTSSVVLLLAKLSSAALLLFWYALLILAT